MDKIHSDKINLQNVRRIILKVLIGFGVIAIVFFIAINMTYKKLSQLSETVSAILEPNIKLIKLKEISGCLYGAAANVKAYSIRRDTAYLLSYENYINYLNTRLDTLLVVSAKGGTIDTNEARSDKNFSKQIDTLRELITSRVDLFSEYIELKTGEGSRDVLLQLLKKIKIKNPIIKNAPVQKVEPPKKSFFSKLFSSKRNKKDTSNFVAPVVSSDSVQRSIQKLISKTQQEEKVKKNQKLSEEMDITQREYMVMNHIFSLLNNMEEKELVEGIKRIHAATKETTAQIRFISNWLTTFGLLLALTFSYFIYHDILRTKRFREQFLLAKAINTEKLSSQYSLSLIEASRDPLVTISSAGKIMDMNEATVKITGMTREKLTGTDFLDYFTEPQKAREVYQEVFSKGFVSDSPLTVRHKDGKLTEVLFNGSVIRMIKEMCWVWW